MMERNRWFLWILWEQFSWQHYEISSSPRCTIMVETWALDSKSHCRFDHVTLPFRVCYHLLLSRDDKLARLEIIGNANVHFSVYVRELRRAIVRASITNVRHFISMATNIDMTPCPAMVYMWFNMHRICD